MIEASKPRIGICSWSLQPGSVGQLVELASAIGVDGIQLALDPLRRAEWSPAEVRDRFAQAGLAILSGMMAPEGEDYSTLESIRRTGGLVPDDTWVRNLRAAAENSRIAAELGIKLVTLHAGFVPPQGAPGHAEIERRIAAVAEAFAAHGVRLGLETGQESAPQMLVLVRSLRRSGHAVGVNFDPANVILYGESDPVGSLRLLAEHVVQVHVKDAVPAAAPGRWGTEVVAGTGAVDWPAFFRVWSALPSRTDLIIEREAGDNRVQDARAAATLIRRFLAELAP